MQKILKPVAGFRIFVFIPLFQTAFIFRGRLKALSSGIGMKRNGVGNLV